MPFSVFRSNCTIGEIYYDHLFTRYALKLVQQTAVRAAAEPNPVRQKLFLELSRCAAESRLDRIPCGLHTLFDRLPRVFTCVRDFGKLGLSFLNRAFECFDLLVQLHLCVGTGSRGLCLKLVYFRLSFVQLCLLLLLIQFFLAHVFHLFYC